MDPITISVVTALSAGAVAIGKEFATSAIKDGYTALKNVVLKHCPAAKPYLDGFEEDPESGAEQEVLGNRLKALPDTVETRATVDALLDAILTLEANPPAGAVFDFGALRALKSFEIHDAEFAGTLVRADTAVFEGDFSATGLRQVQPAGSGGGKKKT